MFLYKKKKQFVIIYIKKFLKILSCDLNLHKIFKYLEYSGSKRYSFEKNIYIL